MTTTITAEEFEALYRTVAPQLFGYLRRHSSLDAEDLVAEVFTTAWRRREQLPEPELRRAWLFGTARRLILAEGRRKGRERAAVPLLVINDSDDADTHDEIVAQAMADALGRLRPDERDLLLLIEWERLTPAEAAVALGIRPGAARVRLHRARQALAADPRLAALIREPQLGDCPGDARVPASPPGLLQTS